MHIAVAEDEAPIRNLLAGIISQQGHEVAGFENGRDVLAHIRGGAPCDLLVTDIQMPKMNGLELIEALGEDRPDLPVVVVTGHGDMDLLIELIRLGCDDFVHKPIKARELTEKISQVLEMKRRREEEARREQAELVRRHSELAREAEAYARGAQDLRGEIEQAVALYQELLQLDPDDYRAPVAWKVQTYKSLGGDYLGISETPDGCDVLVADVAGHDLAASYHTVLIKAFFDRNFHTDLDGGTFFKVLNRELYDNGRNERMVTASFLRLDFTNMRGELVAAGHPRLVSLRPGASKPEDFMALGTVLGVQETISLDVRAFDIAPGQRFFLYTDGLVNSGWVDGPTGLKHRLGDNGLDRLIARHADETLQSQVECIWEDVMRFCRYKQNDDMLLFGLEVPSAGQKLATE